MESYIVRFLINRKTVTESISQDNLDIAQDDLMGWIIARVDVTSIQWPSNNVPHFMGISQMQCLQWRQPIDQPTHVITCQREEDEGVGNRDCQTFSPTSTSSLASVIQSML